MKRNITVLQDLSSHVNDLPVEIVERKGVGHPDSLCDGIAREIAKEYSHWCQENLNTLLHHNFDKVQLVAGESRPHFGGGEMIKPIRIQIAGRGTKDHKGRAVPVDTLAITTARAYIKKTMRYLDPDKHIVIDCFAGHGSSDLRNTVGRVKANDTSFGVAHWPRSPLENMVYEISQYLNNLLVSLYPIGEDTKVMGCRYNGKVTLTCSIPLISTAVKNAKEYLEIKKELQNLIKRFARQFSSQEIKATINNADNPKNGDFYLTLTGTSAECGDDGQVGRGNRVTGFIAPFRSSSLEATCGKNAISHVGLIYNVLALETAQRLCESLPDLSEATVYILSQIGAPLDQPLLAAAMVRLKHSVLREELSRKIHSVIDHSLAKVEETCQSILNGTVALF